MYDRLYFKKKEVNFSIKKRTFLLGVWGVLFVFLHVMMVHAAIRVEHIKLYQSSRYDTLQIMVSGKPSYKWHRLHKPERFVLDLRNAVSRALKKPYLKNSVMKNMRWAQHKGTFRLVLDLIKPVQPQLRTTYHARYKRYSIDMTFPKSKRTTRSTASTTSRARTSHKVIVVVDPGHGGRDPGAIGYRNYQEKRITFAIATLFAQYLNREYGIKAYLTRSKDVYLSLRRRLEFARNRHADLFISIHANALKKRRRVRGAMIFALSTRGATSEMGRWLAKQENSESNLLGGQHGIPLKSTSNRVAKVLLDLSLSNTIAQSTLLGNAMLQAFKQSAIRMHSKKVEKAGFIVLKSPDIPSVLVETGFLTTPVDARLLASKLYQKRFATALVKAVNRYLHQYPPIGTDLFYKFRQNNAGSAAPSQLYKVKSGDTLSSIAAKFNIPMSVLLQTNRLKSAHRLHVGDMIKIHRQRTYKVRAGDSLSVIAQRFKVSMEKIIIANKISDSRKLPKGKVLIIPY